MLFGVNSLRSKLPAEARESSLTIAERHDASWIVQCRRAAGACAANVRMLLAASVCGLRNFKGEIMTQEHVMLAFLMCDCSVAGKDWGYTVLGFRFAINCSDVGGGGGGCYFVCRQHLERNTPLGA